MRYVTFQVMSNIGLWWILASGIFYGMPSAVFGFSPSLSSSSTLSSSRLFASREYNRRQIFSTTCTSAVMALSLPQPSTARAPGSKDIVASIQQIQDAAESLKQLIQDDNWSNVAVIDAEGRAGSTDSARRVLGGIAPQAGSAAIDAAKNTPLYRIDVAFVTVRKAVLEDDSDNSWTSEFDLDKFEELADRIIYNIQKSDGNFYSVLFAMKGTDMIQDIFKETKGLVKQGIQDFEEMIQLLKDAGAPGVI